MLPDNAADEARKNREENKLDRRKVDNKTIKKLEKAIKNIDDPDAADTVRELAHVITGDNRFEK